MKIQRLSTMSPYTLALTASWSCSASALLEELSKSLKHLSKTKSLKNMLMNLNQLLQTSFTCHKSLKVTMAKKISESGS